MLLKVDGKSLALGPSSSQILSCGPVDLDTHTHLAPVLAHVANILIFIVVISVSQDYIHCFNCN